MKLVEILARELNEWPEGFKDVGQALAGELHLPGIGDHVRHTKEKYTKSEDWGGAIVTKEQWQAERDRQKGGEWKRHRGGKQPVADGTHCEYRYRDGTTLQGCNPELSNWSHYGATTDIMAFRVISQPQAEEVEVRKLEGRDVRLEELMTGHRLPYEVHCGEVIHGPISMGDEVIAPAHPKWGQIDGPIKWRDTVNELDAYIEEFTRERESLINRLALEGFALIPAMTPVIGATPSSLPFAEWSKGDVLTSKVSYGDQFTKDKTYKVKATKTLHGENRVTVESDDRGHENGWAAGNFEFHSRP